MEEKGKGMLAERSGFKYHLVSQIANGRKRHNAISMIQVNDVDPVRKNCPSLSFLLSINFWPQD